MSSLTKKAALITWLKAQPLLLIQYFFIKQRSLGHEKHERNVEDNTSRRQVFFSSFLKCSQMSEVFYHSVIHPLCFFICFDIEVMCQKNSKTCIFYVLYSHNTWVFDQSEHILYSVLSIM